MADPIIPPGAFAAMKAGTPPPAPQVKTPKPADPPKVELRKAPPKEVAEETPEAPPAELTPAEKKIWKLKADGEEFEFDASDEEAIKREIMKARGADKRFMSAAALKKQAETFFEMLKNPESLKKVLTDPRVGVDVKKFAEDLVWEHIQESQLTPEQKAQREKDRRLAEYEEKEKKAREEGLTREKQAEIQRHEAHFEKTIMQALELGGIPKTVESASRMAKYLMAATEQGLDLSPQDIVDVVRKDYLEEFGAVMGAAEGEQMLAFLGDKNTEKVREALLKKLKSPQGNPFPRRSDAKQASQTAEQPRVKKIPASQWKEDLARDFLNRRK